METIRLGDLDVKRLGYGAMRLPGEGVWGEPRDPEAARAVLRRAIDLGIELVDTAWYYGPFVSHQLIREALHPYPKQLVIATKLGGKRLPDKSWAAHTSPDGLREGLEHDLRLLRLERVDIVHFRWIPSPVPFEESLDALIEEKKKGKIRHLALSNVSVAQIEAARARTPIVAVQNPYSVAQRNGAPPYSTAESGDDVLAVCEKHDLAFLPYFPLAMGKVDAHAPLAEIARRRTVKPAQIAIAWLLSRSPKILPIPGTSSIAHLEENWAARDIRLEPDEMTALDSGK
jgi:aryl-alcohol dehydrogenase-like predicted oxidoreductase